MTSPEYYMARAIRLAERGLYTTDPNPRVGCVIVKNNQIIGEGWHQRAGKAHAEINALHYAGHAANNADCYVTLEPCSHYGRTPPCAESLIQANIRRIFIASKDPNPLVAGKGIKLLENAGIEVHIGLLQQQAEALNPGFYSRMKKGRPFVTSKIAMSIDGRMAMASGESKWITSEDARQDVHKIRARSSAILTGMGTVLADNPALTVRPERDWYPAGEEVRQPWRIVVGNRKIPSDYQLAANPEKLVHIVSKPQKANHQIIQVADNNGQVDLASMLNALAKLEVNEVLIEAGSQLNGTLLQGGLIDKLIIYTAPIIMGNSAKGIFHLPALQQMKDAIELEILDIRQVGKDWRITANPIVNKGGI